MPKGSLMLLMVCECRTNVCCSCCGCKNRFDLRLLQSRSAGPRTCKSYISVCDFCCWWCRLSLRLLWRWLADDEFDGVTVTHKKLTAVNVAHRQQRAKTKSCTLSTYKMQLHYVVALHVIMRCSRRSLPLFYCVWPCKLNSFFIHSAHKPHQQQTRVCITCNHTSLDHMWDSSLIESTRSAVCCSDRKKRSNFPATGVVPRDRKIIQIKIYVSST